MAKTARVCDCGAELAKYEHRCPPCREAHAAAQTNPKTGRRRGAPPGPRDPARIREWTSLYRYGFTLREIGEMYGLTRQRVNQVIDVPRGEGGFLIGFEERKLKKETGAARLRQRLETACFKKWGCSRAEQKRLSDAGVINAWWQQRANARRRGIAWEFRFPEWLRIWTESGKLSQRGRGRGVYVMARFGDAGPYAPGNVEIALATENSSQSMTRMHAEGRLSSVSRCGSGRGWTKQKSRSRPYLAQAKGMFLGAFETPEAARAAYVAYWKSQGITVKEAA